MVCGLRLLAYALWLGFGFLHQLHLPLLLLLSDSATLQPASRAFIRWRVGRHWLAVLVLCVGGGLCRAQSVTCSGGEVRKKMKTGNTETETHPHVLARRPAGALRSDCCSQLG